MPQEDKPTSTKQPRLFCCGIKCAYGFPADASDAYTASQLEAAKNWINGWDRYYTQLVVVNSLQKKAKQMLKEAGFIVLGITHSEEDNKRLLYLMGRGFTIPARKRGVRKVSARS